MCNLYSMTRAQDAMRKLFGVKHDRAGNLPSMPGIFPDQIAPIVRLDKRRGTPLAPPKLRARPVTNVRNTASAYWRPWLMLEFPSLVPGTSPVAPLSSMESSEIAGPLPRPWLLLQHRLCRQDSDM
jgi:putative SOS response-associated peptidase YedK